MTRRVGPRPARVRRIAAVMAVVLVAAALLSACGGSGGGGAPSSASGREWKSSAVVRLAALHRTSDLAYHLSAHPGCATLVLLLSTAEVDTYKGSGDEIVTNPDRSAGADVTTQSASCRRLFAQALSHVR